MSRMGRKFASFAGVGLVIVTIALGVLFFRFARNSTPTVQEVQVQATATWPPSEATEVILPTPTLPPVPTAIPTPVVTVVPVDKPPFIDSNPVPLAPFWIYYWQGNEIWRVGSDGNDREVVLDTYKQFGQWLTANPIEGSDCCWSGPRVSISPDNKKLALVVVDKEQINDKNETFVFSVYTYDLEHREVKFISPGINPRWSSDGQRLAFINDDELYIADLVTGDMTKRVSKHKEAGILIAEFSWSPDNKQIAFMYQQGAYQRLPVIWLANVDDTSEPIEILRRETAFQPGFLQWSLDSQQIFYLSSEGSKDHYASNQEQNLWSVVLATGEARALTDDMFVHFYGVLLDQKQIHLSGYRLYERTPDANPTSDIWLLDPTTRQVKRITEEKQDLFAFDTDPTGTYLLIGQGTTTPFLLSLVDGTRMSLDLSLMGNYLVGGKK
jgi:Tol biopolymer transport system component